MLNYLEWNVACCVLFGNKAQSWDHPGNIELMLLEEKERDTSTQLFNKVFCVTFASVTMIRKNRGTQRSTTWQSFVRGSLSY
jgi:hypothetical protein